MSLLRQYILAFQRAAPMLGSVLRPVGVVLLLLAAVVGLERWRQASPLVRARGVVTENVSSFAARGGVVYAPKVRFRLQDGTFLQFIGGPARDDAEFAPGDSFPVLYPPGQPQAAVIATAWHWYGTAIWLAIWGVAAFDLGLILKRLPAAPTV